MRIIADLHIHGKHSRGCSTDLTIQNLEKWGRVKGLDLLGTGDFTHPKWLKHIKESLTEKDGFLETKTGFKFVLQTEISLIYTQDGKGRRVHVIILSPDLEVVEKINEYLRSKGRLDYDGRPIFKIPCYELVEELMMISEDIEIIPAHIWTPWFSLFGSNSGFNSAEDAFKDQIKHIHAMETGLSSEPAMNSRVKDLDNFLMVSFSDAHSFWPWRIGREATIFDIEPNYKALIKAIRTKEGFIETIEVDPAYGKYHIDGHRNCNVSMEPEETKKHKGICPSCHKPLTIGVLYRVEELADREEKTRQPFKILIPLSELISHKIGKGIATKSVWNIYNQFIEKFGNEYSVLLDAPEEELSEVDNELAELIMLNRKGKIEVKPGYDGVYGEPIIGKKPEQKGLGEF